MSSRTQRFILFTLVIAALYFSTYAKDHPHSKRMIEARAKAAQHSR